MPSVRRLTNPRRCYRRTVPSSATTHTYSVILCTKQTPVGELDVSGRQSKRFGGLACSSTNNAARLAGLRDGPCSGTKRRGTGGPGVPDLEQYQARGLLVLPRKETAMAQSSHGSLHGQCCTRENSILRQLRTVLMWQCGRPQKSD